MTQLKEADRLATLLREYRQSALGRLDSAGSVKTGCESLDVAGDSISFATDPSCESFNDDFIAFWKPEQNVAVGWAAAIADGVTGSLLAQHAAELACLFGLSGIAKSNEPSRSIISKNPIAFASRLFQQLGRHVASEPEIYRPSDCPNSIWQLAVREGKFLQTTLTLIWSTSEGLRIMAVGDGGVLYSYNSEPDKFTSHTFGSGKLQCLGPRSSPGEPEAYLLEDWSSVACYTDGLAEAIEEREELPAMMFDQRGTVATLIDYLNDKFPEVVNDNLSAFRVARVGR